MRKFKGGLEGASILEIALIFGLVGLIAWFYYRQHRNRQINEDIRLRKRAFNAFARYVKSRNIVPSEEKLLERLTAFLELPHYQKHWLFEQEDLFNKCVRKLDKDTSEFHYQLMALKAKLGFTEKKDGKVLRNTVDVPVGTVFYDQHRGQRALFEVTEINHNYLTVRKLHEIKAGIRELELLMRRREGMYFFQALVVRQEGNLVFLRHSGLLFRQQRRQYLRSELQIGVELAGEAGRSVNLSGGGALLELYEPISGLIEDESYTIMVQFSETRYIETVFRVIEIISTNRLRGEFTNLHVSDQDYIIQYVMSHSRESIKEATTT